MNTQPKIVKAGQWKELLYSLVRFFDAQEDTAKVIYQYINKKGPMSQGKQWHGSTNGIERLLSYDTIRSAWENGGDMALAKLAAFVHYYGSKIEIGNTKMIVTSDDILNQARYIKDNWRPDNGMDTQDFTLNWEDLQEITKRVIGKLLEEGYYAGQADKPGVNRYYKMKWDYRYPFGMYNGKRVDDVYKSGITGKEYVGWVYYNMEMVDYDQNIINELGLQPIEKPGKNEEMFKVWRDANFSEEEKAGLYKGALGRISHSASMKRKIQNKRYGNFIRGDERAFTKGKMAWKNQGH